MTLSFSRFFRRVGEAAEGSGRTAGVKLTFGIPLKATNDQSEWVVLCDLLTATVRSVYNQTDQSFHILLACDRTPELQVTIDERLELLPAPSVVPRSYQDGNNDAGHKRWRIARHFVDRGGGYLMFLDADDLVSKNLVSFVDRNPHRSGYIFEKGYALDAETSMVLPIPCPGTADVPFHQMCGSSTIVRLLPEDMISAGGEHSRFGRLYRMGHTSVGSASAEDGRALLPLPFSAAVYVVGTSTSQSVMRAQEDPNFAVERQQWRRAFTDKGFHVSRIADEFGLAKGTLPRLT